MAGAPVTTEDALGALYADARANVDRLAELLRRLRIESDEVAGRKWAATIAHLAQLMRARPAPAGAVDAVAALELSRGLSDLYLREVVDELEAELNETPPDRADLVRVLREIEQNAEDGLALADQLFRTALDHMQAR